MLTVPTPSITPDPGLSDPDGWTSACLEAGMAPMIGARRRMTDAMATRQAVIRTRPSCRSGSKTP